MGKFRYQIEYDEYMDQCWKPEFRKKKPSIWDEIRSVLIEISLIKICEILQHVAELEQKDIKITLEFEGVEPWSTTIKKTGL